ncbi:hypothetical protein SAY86_008048 [Trapa natans]|uniref:Uncharacterized protein n=1 Tax=Trapa natans TaxID=22666 RepID=A0AAN7LG54_TRANT|nr:hypothetical protein SAY86_008048 [Trapa natans]
MITRQQYYLRKKICFFTAGDAMGVGQEPVDEFSSSRAVNSGISLMRFLPGLQREEMLASGKRMARWNQSRSIIPITRTELQLPAAAIVADLRAQREREKEREREEGEVEEVRSYKNKEYL